MSKSQDTLTLPLSVDAVHAACIEAAKANGWRIKDSDLEHFFLSQQISFLDRLYRFPSDCVIFLHREKPRKTRVELFGRIRGFGPLQMSRVKRALGELKAAIEIAARDSIR
ncbi:MAG: hypothetical protein O7I42_08925 [Alphaproteobacteria bacterium]|nr:hypothetical protein [Alphaproteobacteria bacterium]